MAFVIGKDSALGQTISTAEADEYIFGLLLFNDWSARDIQAWPSFAQQGGPFIGHTGRVTERGEGIDAVATLSDAQRAILTGLALAVARALEGRLATLEARKHVDFLDRSGTWQRAICFFVPSDVPQLSSRDCTRHKKHCIKQLQQS